MCLQNRVHREKLDVLDDLEGAVLLVCLDLMARKVPLERLDILDHLGLPVRLDPLVSKVQPAMTELPVFPEVQDHLVLQEKEATQDLKDRKDQRLQSTSLSCVYTTQYTQDVTE